MKIKNINGRHLTDTDIRNIKAVLAQTNFVEGETYKVNNRKDYSLTTTETGYEVTVGAIEIDDFGRRFHRKSKSTFTTTD